MCWEKIRKQISVASKMSNQQNIVLDSENSKRNITLAMTMNRKTNGQEGLLDRSMSPRGVC